MRNWRIRWSATTTLLPGLILCGLLLPRPASAGADAGGVLLVHANSSLSYTTDVKDYAGRGALKDGAQALTSVPLTSGHTSVFFVYAAFPPESSPRLTGVTFGIRYDARKIGLVAHGKCGDTEIPGPKWPAPDTGTSVVWKTAQTSKLTEIYWFAGYAYAKADTTSFALTAHPDTNLGGFFADDAVPAQLDPITAYGRLGFGTAGVLPSPGKEKKGAETPAR